MSETKYLVSLKSVHLQVAFDLVLIPLFGAARTTTKLFIVLMAPGCVTVLRATVTLSIDMISPLVLKFRTTAHNQPYWEV